MAQYLVYTLDDLTKGGGLPFGNAKGTGPGRTGPSAGQDTMGPTNTSFTEPVKHDPRQKRKEQKGKVYLPLDMPGVGISKAETVHPGTGKGAPGLPRKKRIFGKEYLRFLKEAEERGVPRSQASAAWENYHKPLAKAGTPEGAKKAWMKRTRSPKRDAQKKIYEDTQRRMNAAVSQAKPEPVKPATSEEMETGYKNLFSLLSEGVGKLKKSEGYVKPHWKVKRSSGKAFSVGGHRRRMPLMEAMVWQVAKDHGLSRNAAEQMVMGSLTVNDQFTGIKHELDPESLVLRVDLPDGASLVKKHATFEEARQSLDKLRAFSQLTHQHYESAFTRPSGDMVASPPNMELIRAGYASTLKRKFGFDEAKTPKSAANVMKAIEAENLLKIAKTVKLNEE